MAEDKTDFTQETEILKALKEEYEAKLAEQKNKFETTLTTMRSEHAKQLREILRTGETPQVMDKKEDADDDEDEDVVAAAVKKLSAKWKKKK